MDKIILFWKTHGQVPGESKDILELLLLIGLEFMEFKQIQF